MLAAMKRARGRSRLAPAQQIIPPPANVESVAICALSGARPSPWCPAVQKEWLPTDQQPRFCDWHHDGSVRLPPEYGGLLLTEGVKRASAERPEQPTTVALRIANPPDGATYLIDPTLRMEYQTLRLRAIASTRVAWHVDDRRIGIASPGRALEWRLSPGPHTITATDDAGRRDAVKIFVK